MSSHNESINVLVVDDEKELADMYSMWLSSEYAVTKAYNGEEALSQLDESIDVMLLDRRMPLLTGDEVLDELDKRGMSVRVAVVSAVTPDFDVIDMGFDDYLVKPVIGEDLLETVESLIERQEYDDTTQRLTALSTKRAKLESEKDMQELEDSKQYQELVEEIEELKSSLDEKISGFGDEDYKAMFRDM